MEGLFSKIIKAGERTYFVDVREARDKSRYIALNLTEPDNDEERRFKRTKIVITAEYTEMVLEAIAEAGEVLRGVPFDEAANEKRRRGNLAQAVGAELVPVARDRHALDSDGFAPVAFVSREDLYALGYVEPITDENLRAIAGDMGEIFVDSSFHKILNDVADRYLDAPEEKGGGR